MTWSNKYKKSIDCNNPKGFSQKAHCQARKLRQAGKETKSSPVNEATKMTSLEKFRQAAAEREKKHQELEKQMKARHASGKEDLKGAIDRLEKAVNKEDVSMVGGSPANVAGSGAVAGLGVGPQGEPGVKLRNKKKVVPFAIFSRKPTLKK